MITWRLNEAQLILAIYVLHRFTSNDRIGLVRTRSQPPQDGYWNVPGSVAADL